MIRFMTFCSGFLLLFLALFLEAHEGHHAAAALVDVDLGKAAPTITSWINWIGRFHLLLLHFPIALIIMTVVAEWLNIWYNQSLFEHAARFMIAAAAIFAPLTAVLGFALGYGQHYEGLSLDLYEWHRYMGVLTAGLTVAVALLKERYIRQLSPSLTPYYICLVLLFICINLTGTFGGSLAFGFNIW